MSDFGAGNAEYEYESQNRGVSLQNVVQKYTQVTTNSGSIRPMDLNQVSFLSSTRGKTKYVISSSVLTEERFDSDPAAYGLDRRMNSAFFQGPH